MVEKLIPVMGNPAMDIFAYCMMVLVSGALTQFVFDRYFWCPACAGPLFGGSER